ncbi:MAG: ABC transporter permease [Chloroflexota bacterium]
MQTNRSLGMQVLFVLLPIAASLLVSAGLVMLVGRNPVEVATTVWEGAFRDLRRVAGVFNFWIPLTLATLGVVVTFRAGLWNIGVEGQMMFGAIAASGVAIFVGGGRPFSFFGTEVVLTAPSYITLPLAIVAAMFGGMFWALVVGLLKTRLGVHEIFGGVALNAIANVFTNYLVGNAWAPEGGSALDTGPFAESARLGTVTSEFPTNVTMIIFVLISAVAVTLALRGTRWGLELKATGHNPRSALLLGVATERTALSAFIVCGALAGIGGAYRVLFTFGTLRPLVSGGIGFLAILVSLLVSHQALSVAMVTFIFAALLFGSTRLRVAMRLDASLAQVLQGVLVLLVMLSNGLRTRFFSDEKPPPDEVTKTKNEPQNPNMTPVEVAGGQD